MRTIHFVTRGTQGPRKVFALYNVVDTNAQGATKTLVEISIDFDSLSTLAGRAVENTSGEAGLYYGAITAKVQS